MRPDQAEAVARADEIVGRREHTEVDPARLVRPRSVTVGCVMTGIGAAVMVYNSVGLFLVDESSKGVEPDESVAQEDRAEAIDTAVQIAHGLGVVFGFWALLLLVFAVFAFLGRRWAANALVVMAGVVLLSTLVALFTAFAAGVFTTLAWSVIAASLVRLREPAKDWWRALREQRQLTLAAR
jgi:hypothetical protein